MTRQDQARFERLRSAFEGRDAIYIEKGVLVVRASNIACDVGKRVITADVHEVPIRGLEKSLLHQRSSGVRTPLHWRISAGHLTTFSFNTWKMGYGGWSMFFNPTLVAAFIEMASCWHPALSAAERYKQANAFLVDRQAHERSIRVFSD